MKIKSYLVIVNITIIALLGTMIPKVTVDANDENFTYFDNGDGTVTITGYNGPKEVDVVIPSELGGLTVTAIDDGESLLSGVFSHKGLTSVVIPNSVTRLGNNAFNDNQLTNIIIPDSVTSIGDAAFRNNNLSEIKIPASVTSIGAGAFSGNQYQSSHFIIYGMAGTEAQTYANSRNHTFIALDTPPIVNIKFEDGLVNDVLELDLNFSGELEADYRHDGSNWVTFDDVIWTIDENTVETTEDTFVLDPYTNSIGEKTIALEVRTNYGATATKEITLNISLPVPNTPHLTVDSTDETEIHLSWDSVQFADKYILVRDGEEVYRGTLTSYKDTGLVPGTTYNYSLVTENTSGASDASVVDVQTRYPIPDHIAFELLDREGNDLLQGTSLDEVWFNQDLYVDVIVDGHQDDMYEYAFVFQGESINEWQSEWNGERLEIMESVEEDGVVELHVRITNGDGEAVEAVFGPIQIDRTPPTINVSMTTEDGAPYMLGDWTSQTVTIQANMNDFLSGIAKQEISIDGGLTWSPFEELFHITEDGKHTIAIAVTDHAGNKEVVIKESINIKRIRRNVPPILPPPTDETNEKEESESTPTFSDIDHLEHKDGIEELVDRGIISGYHDGTFRPDVIVQRGQYVAFIVRHLDLPQGNSTFTDLPKTAALYEEVSRGIKAGIIQGTLDGKSLAYEPVTKADVAVMTQRALKLVGDYDGRATLDYADERDIGRYARDAIAQMKHYGIMEADSSNRFNPEEPVSRADASLYIYRVIQLIHGEQSNDNKSN